MERLRPPSLASSDYDSPPQAQRPEGKIGVKQARERNVEKILKALKEVKQRPRWSRRL
jgi:hypothetical protein